MRFSITALFASILISHATAGVLLPRQDADTDALPPSSAPTPGVSIPPQPFAGLVCTTNAKSPSYAACKIALSKIPRTDAPLSCTKIYKPWHVVSSYGGCEIGYWSTFGNAHCQSNNEMIQYVERVLEKCVRGRPGGGYEEEDKGGSKSRRAKVEGYEAVGTMGERGVWVYGKGA